MSREFPQAQSSAQASGSGQAAGVGAEVGGVRSSWEGSGIDLACLSAETRAWLKAQSRDSACTHAWPRSEGYGDGSARAGIITPEQVRPLQRTLYRKAKAQPKYRFWSLYGEITRRDVLEHALQRVAVNQGGPGVDGQTIDSITANPQTQRRWLDAVQQELKTKSYRPRPVRRVFIPKRPQGQRPLGIPTVVSYCTWCKFV